ncbi:MAG: NADH:ubiquinone reductase (Na(+)-transporting) subunit C [Prevotella sp.]
MANDKKGLNTNSNTYTIVYSALLVIVVAFLLAFVFQTLKPLQDDNVKLDKKKQILAALNLRNLADQDAYEKYKEMVVADEIIDAKGTVTAPGAQGGENDGFRLNSADMKQGHFALYVCKVDGQTKYVIPVYGMGLWGAISGYIAIDEDKETVFGAYFNHESETAGLGAEIKDDTSWQESFRGKKLFGEGGREIALAVVKKKDNEATQVDAITGATLTSDGVTAMLRDCLGAYLTFLTDK